MSRPSVVIGLPEKEAAFFSGPLMLPGTTSIAEYPGVKLPMEVSVELSSESETVTFSRWASPVLETYAKRGDEGDE